MQAALSDEAAKVRSAGEGARHGALLRAAYSLAGLDRLSEADIAGALVPAFVSVAGESRRSEAERTVRDTVEARKRSM